MNTWGCHISGHFLISRNLWPIIISTLLIQILFQLIQALMGNCLIDIPCPILLFWRTENTQLAWIGCFCKMDGKNIQNHMELGIILLLNKYLYELYTPNLPELGALKNEWINIQNHIELSVILISNNYIYALCMYFSQLIVLICWFHSSLFYVFFLFIGSWSHTTTSDMWRTRERITRWEKKNFRSGKILFILSS